MRAPCRLIEPETEGVSILTRGRGGEGIVAGNWLRRGGGIGNGAAGAVVVGAVGLVVSVPVLVSLSCSGLA